VKTVRLSSVRSEPVPEFDHTINLAIEFFLALYFHLRMLRPDEIKRAFLKRQIQRVSDDILKEKMVVT
jgi:hypothetical protein